MPLTAVFAIGLTQLSLTAVGAAGVVAVGVVVVVVVDDDAIDASLSVAPPALPPHAAVESAQTIIDIHRSSRFIRPGLALLFTGIPFLFGFRNRGALAISAKSGSTVDFS